MSDESVVSFEVAAEQWLVNAQKRKRKPIRPASVPSIRSAFDEWILPHLGKLLLDKVHNGTVKKMVAAMDEAGRSPKTINTYVGLVKVVVASVVNEETGEPVFMRKWSSTAMDMPVIENQKQPSYTKEEVEYLLMSSAGWERMLYTILAATGLRIGEALALEARHVTNGGRTLMIGQQIDRFGKIVPYTKTKAGGTEFRPRQVDLHPDVTDQLLPFVRGKEGLLFATRQGTPHFAKNLWKRRLSKLSKKGWHAFRRFRETHLSDQSCNNDITIFWMGHQPETMSELYSKLARETEKRLKEAERVGTGFDAKVPTQFRKRGNKFYWVGRPADVPATADELGQMVAFSRSNAR